MDKLEFKFQSKRNTDVALTTKAICGVVGSGNLEVFVEYHDDQNICHIDIQTSAKGFSSVWHSVLEDFTHNYLVGGLRFRLNDMGATPAVVTLRLGQALSLLKEEKHGAQ